MTTWQEIETAGNNSKHFQFTMAAYDNAATTVYEEKQAEESELGQLFLLSLGGLLAYSDDMEACEFFAALGVKW